MKRKPGLSGPLEALKGAGLALCAAGLGACASLQGQPPPRAPAPALPASAQGSQVFTLNGLPANLSARAESLLRSDQPAPESLLEKINNARRASRLIEDLLASEGWLAAKVNPGPLSLAERVSPLEVDPGALFVISAIRIDGIEALDPGTSQTLAEIAGGLKTGQPARTADIERMEAALVGHLQEAGYAFATSPGIDALASRQDGNVALTYTLRPGPRVRLGALLHAAPSARSQRAIAILKPWKDGDFYRPSLLDKLSSRLSSSRLYDAVGVTLSETPTPEGTYPVRLSLTRAERRTIRVGASASTTDGIGADVTWQRRDLTGRADSLDLKAQAATLSRSLGAEYEIPNAGRFGRLLGASAGLRGEETNAYDLTGFRIGARLVEPVSARMTASLGTEIDLTRTEDRRFRILAGPREQVTLSVPVSLAYSDVSDLLDPQAGLRAAVSTETGLSVGDKTAGYVRLTANAARYTRLSDRLVLALRGEYGTFAGSDAVPADRLFFAGGGGSVRGYEYQSLSPKGPGGDILGGRSLFTASAELRWRRSERLGYAAFIDAGAAGDDAGSAFSEARASVGAGLRYYPGFGPVRLDIGVPLSPGKDGAPAQVYISIGQAF